MITIDFETKAIVNGSGKSPEPVGVAIKVDDGPSRYYAWGHPTDNNCTMDDVRVILRETFIDHPDHHEVLMHNAKFDMRICVEWFDIPLNSLLPHDTLFLAFLNDPRETSLSLKPLADKYLGMAPEEQDDLKAWLIANVREAKESNFGAYISEGPADLVGHYAKGDVDRTYALFNYLSSTVNDDTRLMLAYERERRLLPIVIDLEIRGVPIDPGIGMVTRYWQQEFDKGEKLLSEVSSQKPGSRNFFNDLMKQGHIDKENIEYTDKGNPRFGRESLERCCKTPELLKALQKRSKLQKILGTYLKPWEESFNTYGRMYPYFNQVRGEDDRGTRTGRFSSNLQQVPKKPSGDLPHLRKLIHPEPGHTIIKRDYCFTPDTEFLTNNGFKLFDDITDDDLLADWCDGTITYYTPLRRVDFNYVGDAYHCYGERSFDFIATADHRMVFQRLNSTDKSYFKVPLSEAKIGDGSHWYMPTSGIWDSQVDIPAYKRVLIAAYQADFCNPMNMNRSVWAKFKKERKLNRVIASLKEAGIKYNLSTNEAYPGFTWVRFQLPEWMDEYVTFTKEKEFTRRVLGFDAEFLEEVCKWDGYKNQYYTSNKNNAELISELCVLRGRATNLISLPAGVGNDGIYRKERYVVTIRGRDGVYCKTQTKIKQHYRGRVVCFEMPSGNLICRRNGFPFVAGNCGQELRVAAHYAEGDILDAYIDNPDLDVHTFMQQLIYSTFGEELSRAAVKEMNFLKLYGGGARSLSQRLGVSEEDARKLFKTYDSAIPHFKQLSQDVERHVKGGNLLRTWGGRTYDVEPAKYIKGKYQTFYYKMVNVLIQGSSADMSKEAMIRYYYHPKRHPDARILLVVHDEIVLSVPDSQVSHEMALLKWAMDEIPGWDVPLRSDGAVGKNFGDLTPYEDV